MGDSITDLGGYEWITVEAPPIGDCEIHHEMTVLGYDRDAGTLDLMIRFDDRGGHCSPHRHITTTSVFVVAGEQHLQDLLPNGERVAKVRPAGGYHLTTGDPHPHLERGGPDGAVVFYSHHTTDGRLYETIDEHGEVRGTVMLDDLIAMWENR